MIGRPKLPPLSLPASVATSRPSLTNQNPVGLIFQLRKCHNKMFTLLFCDKNYHKSVSYRYIALCSDVITAKIQNFTKLDSTRVTIIKFIVVELKYGGQKRHFDAI